MVIKIYVLLEWVTIKQRNKDEWRLYYKEYLLGNKDKTRGYTQKRKVKNHKISKKEWEDAKNYFNNSCSYCGLPASEHSRIYSGKIQKCDLHKEHVIDDGRNDLKNCIPSCARCNSSKHTKTLNEFYNPSNPDYTYERYHKIYMWMRYDSKKYIKQKKNGEYKKLA